MFRENALKTEQALEQQRQTWNKYSAGWQKWDDLIMSQLKPVGDELTNALILKGNEKILDVASGTGEPGLSLCSRLPGGMVYGTDLSENMVLIARENSLSKGVKNYVGITCDAAKLPFQDNSIDHVICRFGIMFFPDIAKGLKEMRRVLKKGGTLSVAVWAGPELNPFITLMASTVMQKLGLPAPPPDTPGIFRCALPGLSSKLLQDVGMKSVTERNIKGIAGFDSSLHYWNVMKDVAGPIMQALTKASDKLFAEVKRDVIEKARGFEKDGKIAASWEAIIAAGVK